MPRSKSHIRQLRISVQQASHTCKKSSGVRRRQEDVAAAPPLGRECVTVSARRNPCRLQAELRRARGANARSRLVVIARQACPKRLTRVDPTGSCLCTSVRVDFTCYQPLACRGNSSCTRCYHLIDTRTLYSLGAYQTCKHTAYMSWFGLAMLNAKPCLK
jgi:hypothetical protein